jgi:hypothetical protein
LPISDRKIFKSVTKSGRKERGRMGNREEKRLRLMQSREQNVHLNYQKQKLAKMKNWYGNSTGKASIKKTT